jgi:hypothetical protein
MFHLAKTVFIPFNKMIVIVASAGWLLGNLWACTGASSNSNEPIKVSKVDTPGRRQWLARIDSIAPLIQPGDLVLRTGNDFTSQSLRSLNLRNKTYSHCGIASIENGTVYVYHALGGEFNPDQKIRRDSLRLFAEPFDNRGIGVYRYQVSDSTRQKILAAAQRLHRAGIMFDMAFDLNTNERMYCAEYVYNSLLLGSKGQIRCNISHIGQFAFVGVDDLFLHPQCLSVGEIVYK